MGSSMVCYSNVHENDTNATVLEKEQEHEPGAMTTMEEVQLALQREQAWRLRLQHDVNTLNGLWEQALDRENELHGKIQEMQQACAEKDIEHQKLFDLYLKVRDNLESADNEANYAANDGVNSGIGLHVAVKGMIRLIQKNDPRKALGKGARVVG
jgi:hypothetical protein